jgi:hypothetical protein
MSHSQTPKAAKHCLKKVSETLKNWHHINLKKPCVIYCTGIKILPRVNIITPSGLFSQQQEAGVSSTPSANQDPPAAATVPILTTSLLTDPTPMEQPIDKQTCQVLV